MEVQSYDFMVKTLQGAPLPALFAITVWFGIYRFWPWYQNMMERRIKDDREYKENWVKAQSEHTNRLDRIDRRIVQMNYILVAIVTAIAPDKPEIVEFVKQMASQEVA